MKNSYLGHERGLERQTLYIRRVLFRNVVEITYDINITVIQTQALILTKHTQITENLKEETLVMNKMIETM